MSGNTIADFLAHTAETLWQEINRGPIADEDRDFWLEERRIMRETVRKLRRCDDELTFRLTGNRVLHGDYFDWERVRRALAANGEYGGDLDAAHDLDAARERHPTGNVISLDPLDHDEDPPESETERYWRERDES